MTRLTCVYVQQRPQNSRYTCRWNEVSAGNTLRLEAGKEKYYRYIIKNSNEFPSYFILLDDLVGPRKDYKVVEHLKTIVQL